MLVPQQLVWSADLGQLQGWQLALPLPAPDQGETKVVSTNTPPHQMLQPMLSLPPVIPVLVCLHCIVDILFLKKFSSHLLCTLMVLLKCLCLGLRARDVRVGGGGRTTNVHCPELVLPVWAGNVRRIGSPSSPSPHWRIPSIPISSYVSWFRFLIFLVGRGRVKCGRRFPKSGQRLFNIFWLVGIYKSRIIYILTFGSDRSPICQRIQLTYLTYFCQDLKSSSKSNATGTGIYDPI